MVHIDFWKTEKHVIVVIGQVVQVPVLVIFKNRFLLQNKKKSVVFQENYMYTVHAYKAECRFHTKLLT